MASSSGPGPVIILKAMRSTSPGSEPFHLFQLYALLTDSFLTTSISRNAPPTRIATVHADSGSICREHFRSNRRDGERQCLAAANGTRAEDQRRNQQRPIAWICHRRR